MHSTIFIFANFTFLWKVPSDVESTAAQDEAKRSPERKQWCWQEPLDGDRTAPGNPGCGKGTPRLCSPLPVSGARTLLSLHQLLPPLLQSCSLGEATAAVPPAGAEGMDGAWSTIPRPQQAPGSLPAEAVLVLWSSRRWAGSYTKWCQQKRCSNSSWVDWHSPALCDEPRRLSMLYFLEHKDGLNVLTW